MEKLKHTPAPWYAVNYGGYINIQGDQYYESQNILDQNGCEEAEANGLLCAAAPELLEALQETISCLDRYCIPETSEELKTLYLKSKSAINKALGIKE